jgi:RHS repeat-associated protein
LFTKGNISQVKNTYHWYDTSLQDWDEETLTQNDYTYDDHGNRLTNTIAIDGLTTRTEEYTYDDLQRLTEVDYGNGQTQSYTFDPMGNRLTDSTASYSYNNANMLLTRNGQSYINDPNGNTISGGGRSNVWDSQNRLVSCTIGGNTTTFTYGPDGIRRSMTDSTGTTDFILDGQSVVREKKDGDYKATYLTGPRGIEYRKDDANGEVRWYLYDGLGSVIGEVDNTGTITATNQNDVYGNTLSSSGTSTTDHKFVGKLGHRTESGTNGLIYMGARYYDPALGRFINQDPAQDGANWYLYCGNNPVNVLDTDGNKGMSLDIVTQTFILSAIQGFMFAWGAALACGDISYNSLVTKSLIGAVGGMALALVNGPFWRSVTGSPSLMSRVVKSVGYIKGYTILGASSLVVGLGVGAAINLGTRAGMISFETERALNDF